MIVDDSVVRGTTSHQIVQMARSAGANKVTFTSAAPPIRYPHVYGINMPSRNELIAYNRDINQIENNLFIDKMIYQEVDDLTHAITQNSKIKELEEKIEEMKDFMERARFTPEGLAKYKARLMKMENELNLLKLENQKNTKTKIPSFQEWVKDGKKIPEGLIFTGGSPWFNERTGKNRSPEEVYKIIFRKDP